MDPAVTPTFYHGVFDAQDKSFKLNNCTSYSSIPEEVHQLLQLARNKVEVQCYSKITDQNGKSWASSGGTFTSTYHINNPHAFPFSSLGKYRELDTCWPYMGEEGTLRTLDDMVSISYRPVQENVPDNTLAQIKGEKSLPVTKLPLVGDDLGRLNTFVEEWGNNAPNEKRLACALFFTFENLDQPTLNVIIGRIALPQGFRVIMDFPLEKGASGGSVYVPLKVSEKDSSLTLFATIYGADKDDKKNLNRKSYAALISDLWNADLAVRKAKEESNRCSAEYQLSMSLRGGTQQQKVKRNAANQKLSDLKSQFSSPNFKVGEVEEKFDRVIVRIDQNKYGKKAERDWENTKEKFNRQSYTKDGKKYFSFSRENRAHTIAETEYWRIDKQHGTPTRVVNGKKLSFYPLARQENTRKGTKSNVQTLVSAEENIEIPEKIMWEAFDRSRETGSAIFIIGSTDGKGPHIISSTEMAEMSGEKY